jgi:phosphoserine phosphatase
MSGGADGAAGSVPNARSLWRSAQAVCFDVDSTLSPDEGIDVLAAHVGVGAQVADLTRRAMEGNTPFHEALRVRLELIRPSRALIDACLERHPPRLTPHAAELVSALRRAGKAVHLISGGFLPMVLPIAALLGVPADHCIANRLLFAPDGSYHGFDPACPTARAGGKGLAVAELKRRHGYAPLIMVGDGATDLEARPPADCFIGYGGVVARDKVRASADWFVTDFRELIEALHG